MATPLPPLHSFLFLALNFSLLAISSACYSSCRFHLCHPAPLTLLPPHDRPLSSAICLNGTAIGVANSIPPFLSSHLTEPRPIASYGLPPHLFKTFSLRNGSASVGHQTVQPHQAAMLDGKCVILPLAQTQTSSGNPNLDRPFHNCVSFTVSKSTGSLTTPVPSLTPSGSSIPETPSPSNSPASVSITPTDCYRGCDDDMNPSESPMPPFSVPALPSASTSAPNASESPMPSISVSASPSASTSAPNAFESPMPSISVPAPPSASAALTVTPTSSASTSGSEPLVNKTAGFVSVGATGFVIACSPSQLFLRNSSENDVQIGQIIWNAPNPNEEFCQNCNSVMRIVDSLSPATSFDSVDCPVGETCLLADTSYAKMKDLISEELLSRLGGSSVMDEYAELLLQCDQITTSRFYDDDSSLIQASVRSSVPTRCEDFTKVGADGKCTYSNCFVGDGGSGADCFFCGADCDNTCGPEDPTKNALIPEIIPGVFDFGESCCTHDHCYVSSFSKSACDRAFLRDNLRSCTDEVSDVIYFIPLPYSTLSILRCPIAAFVYYSAVALGGGDAYESAQQSRRIHEDKAQCKQEGDEADMYTDPHIRTFDGLSYDCQAIGEFTLSTSREADFEIQGRFSGPDLRGTVTKGLAVRVKDAPLVQLSIPVGPIARVELVGTCPLLLFVDGNAKNLSTGIASPNVDVYVTGNQVSVRYSNGISVSLSVRNSGWFGCYLEFLRYFLPKSVTAFGDVVGLFGTPNQDPFDDWTTREGEVLEPPRTSTERLFQPAYDYCTTNWCVRNVTESLFTYENGTTFGNFSQCDTPFGTALDLSSAPAELRALCGNDAACLVDGLTGGFAEAQNTLRVQAEVDSRVENRDFRFIPTIIAANNTVNVLISLDVRGSNRTLLQSVEAFALFRVDSDSGAREGDSIIELLDDGSGVTSDETAGDLIFSNVLPIRSSIGGERFSFQAVPVISSVEDPDSPLATTLLNAVRSYSALSSIGERGTNESTVSTASLDGLELLISYTWPKNQRDLDTSTSFLGDSVGFSCGPAPYMTFSGDDTSEAGEEIVVIALDQARTDELWNDDVTIGFFAHWYDARGVGPASLRMVLRDSDTKAEVSSSRLSGAIDPGADDGGCSTTAVAQLIIQVGERVTMSLFTQ